jgi:proteasome lid subunit RPN8/RPN11
MSVEVCGVLLGSAQGLKTVVDACIGGENARQAGSHVTFTQDTWTHIYQVKDSRFPEKRIVGWYHSHPGFGIFLSDQDTFIHRNFFSDPSQIAWVYDPHSDEEGCFAWAGGEIRRLTEIALRDEPGKVAEPASMAMPDHPPLEEPNAGLPSYADRGSRLYVWVGLAISHTLALLLGGIAALFLLPYLLLLLSPQPRAAVPGSIQAPAQSGALQAKGADPK